MSSIKPTNYVNTADDLRSIESLIRINPEQFKDDLERVNAANTLVNMSKSKRKRSRSRSRSRGKTVKKRKPKRKTKRRRGRK